VTATQTLGIGTVALLPCDGELVLAEHHPLLNPGFQLTITSDDGVITSADPTIGFMHRSAEKLFESRDWRQAMALADRHDWLSSFTSEVEVALAFEDALGILPPERATWIRTVLVEVDRITATLAFVAPVAGPLRPDAERLRERWVAIRELATGARVHAGFARVGGVASPLADAVLDGLPVLAAEADSIQAALADAVAAHAEPLAGVAVLTRDQAVDLGTSGPVARASGFDLDLRRDHPSLAYAELADVIEVVTGSGGDVPARYAVLVGQLPVSVRIVRACVDRIAALGDGPVDVLLPKVVRIPEVTTYAWLEGPLGISGCLLVGAGEKTPWRLKIRSASFATMQALPTALVGVPVDQLADAVMSFPMVLGDVDR
jgi:NADH-quinone oxidoreductase subunit D